jgi:sphingolipid delta-4 desaturase
VDGIDVDIPTDLEGKIFSNPITKLLFLIFQVFFYALRPGIVHYKAPSKPELINWAVILTCDILVWYFWGLSSLLYLFFSTLFGAGLHPVAGHFIAEHYIFPNSSQETYSYYGPLNMFTFNVGYHNEHHDFPYIPGSRLPQVRAIAADFYDPLETHSSYVRVMYEYVMNPKITAFSRTKRRRTGADVGGVISDDDKEDEPKRE